MVPARLWKGMLAGALLLVWPHDVCAYTREAVPLADPSSTMGVSGGGCLLTAYNTCSCYTWVFSGLKEGEVWGHLFDADDCPVSCAAGEQRIISDVWFWSQCEPGPPATLGGVALHHIDASACLTDTLWDSGPVTVFSCAGTDRWTHVSVPMIAIDSPFAVTLEIGPAGPPQVRIATDNGIANLFCRMGVTGTFPGCETAGCSCAGWVTPPQNTYIFASDYDGDTMPNDICSIYGAPYPVNFPYYAGYGYLPNNLILQVGMTCSATASVPGFDSTSWGRVKSFYE